MVQGSVNSEVFLRLIREVGRPVHINALTRAAIRAWLEAGATERRYAPGAHYQAGETILLEGQRAIVKAVQPESNPVQGPFSVVTLALPDGTERLMAAGIPDAPAGERRPVGDAQVEEALRSQGAAARRAVRAALSADPHFVSCQTLQGDLWCLADMLPPVSQEDLQKGLAALSRDQEGEEPTSCTTEQLVEVVWGMRDDGSNEYALRAFALSRALEECGETVCLGDRWTSVQTWQAFTVRPTLEAPVHPTRLTLPQDVQAASDVEIAREWQKEVVEVGEESAAPEPAEEDLETWRQDRPAQAVLTLHARHYYEGWLPLDRQVRRLFPPVASGRQEVIVHHHFGDEPGVFRAWVDRRERRIWLSPEMYEVFRRHRIYPGARLRLSARNEREYDIATREPLKTDPIRVWRMWLDEDGTIQYEDHEEPRLYDVDENVYIADVRYEDLEALFRQAEEAGNSIFGLMYRKAVEWWEAAGRRELIVTADRLFEAIHFDERGRATSKATIAWELWRRLAFEPVGGGRYRFRPEFGERVRSTGPTLRRRRRRPQVPVSECWREVTRLEGQELYTLDQKHPFYVFEVSGSALRILVEASGKTRTIERQRIEAAWEHLAREGQIDLAEMRQFTEFNPTYLAAILAALPNVTYQTRPIRLTYMPRQVPVPPAVAEPVVPSAPKPTVERTRTGQLVATDLVPPGPLFETASANVPSESAPSSIEDEFRQIRPRDTEAQARTSDGADADAPPVQGPPPPAQFKKIIRSSQKRDNMQTKTLFSRHYLEHRLPDHPEWAEDPRPVFDAVRALWERARRYGDSWNEAQTEQEFVKPVLEALGWSFIVQPKAGHGGRTTRPDYALFADSRAKDEAQPHQGDDDAFYSRALAVAEAKYWGRPLSQKDSSGRNTWKAESNPSHQMVSYLVGTRVPWGILTNGLVWRLYSREVSSTASEFYEVDLGLLFDFLPAGAEPTPEQLDQFRRWWLFFRRDAFLPDARGKSFVQRVHEGSATYAREISDKLKDLVFEQVMPEIAGGFVAYRYHQKGVREETEESLRQIYQASLSLLYKLLFLLYAEARALLPVTDPAYHEQSLTALAQWAADRLDRGLPLSDATHATPRYDALLALFRRIDQGDPSLGVPRYNGGLFNPASPDNQFLEAHKLSDRAVARAVDTLVRDAGQPVDYAYIGVRNLGAIYEGLLENKLRVVDAATGQVELVNDKGERKATGSYYTPDYIVEYIVQHTLDPILEEREAAFRAAMERCATLRHKLERASDKTTIALLREQLDEAERDAREAFLGIKVLDPAMGSGHFLVNAVDHLTDGIIERMQAFHDEHPDVPWTWNPIQRLIERVRDDILAEMAQQGIAVDPRRLDDTALLTRLVMKRCIYGVDLNPMAVELAKLSLWLHSFTVGAPLSFLDHHLRWGNSLIGADVRTVEREIQAVDKGAGVQLGLFAGPFAGLLDLTSVMTEVAERADATLADVRQSAEDFERFQKALTPYKQVLDLWVSQHFGNKLAYEFLTALGGDVLPALREEREVSGKYREAIARARELWREKRFFHWDLEFPEVFVDLRRRDWAANPGFDAVIGNPPYDVLAEKEREEDLSHFMAFVDSDESLRPARGRKLDLFRLFVAKSTSLVRFKATVGLIVPMSLLADQQTAGLRRYLLSRHNLLRIEAFPQKDDPSQRVFPEAKLPTCIIIAQNSQERGPIIVTTHPGRSLDEISGIYCCDVADLRVFDEESLTIPLIHSTGALNLAKKLSVKGGRLCSIGDLVQTYQGEINETTMAHLLSTDPSVGPMVLRGGNVQRYEFLSEAKQGVNKYLNVRAYEKQVSGEKVAHTKLPRIGYQRNAALDNWRRLIFSPLPSPSYCFDSISYFPVTDEKQAYALLALLNSQLLEWRFRLTSTNNHVSTREIAQLPAVHISFTTPAAERARLAAEAERLAEAFVAGHAPLDRPAYTASPLASFVAARLAASPEQSDVVHDLLAHLAEQMIEMHKEKQGHLRAFRLDLAGYLDEKQLGKLNRLYTPKKPPRPDDRAYERKLAAYEEAVRLAQAQLGPLAEETLALDDFWRLNPAQWMWLLRQNLGDLPKMSGLMAVYEEHHAHLAPLMRRIARTDWLIDQVVYQLYGLSEEEIAVVEEGR